MKKFITVVLATFTIITMTGCGSTEVTNANTDNVANAPRSNATATLPTVADFDATAAWDGVSVPTTDNGVWFQSYEVIAALREQAAAYDTVTPKYTFTLACHDPLASAPGEFLSAWADAVSIATEGAVDFNIGFGGAHSGTMQSLDDMVSGTVDFDWTLPCYFSAYMPLANVIQNPALDIKNATAGSYAMWDLYKENENLQAQAAEVGELLFIWTNCTSPLSYKGNAEINSVSEITGNIRANAGPAQGFVTAVGANVKGCPIGEVYNNVSSGVINYLVTDWHGIKSFQLNEVLNHYVDTNIGCSAYVLMANKDAWNLMDADLQTAIKSVSGDYLLNLVSIWDYWEAAGRYAALEKGGDIFTPSTELKSELDANYAVVAENWINSEDDTTAAQAIYDQADELVKKYNAEFDW